MRMKILLLSDSAAPHTRRWANWFASSGNEVHVVSFNSRVDPGYKDVTLHNLWVGDKPKSRISSISRALIILIKLKLLFHKIKPDVTHSHSLGAYSWSAMLLNLRPRVVTPWGTDILVDINVSKTNRLFAKKSLETSDLITTDAHYFMDILFRFGVDQKKVFLIPFGTDTRIFVAKNQSKLKQKRTLLSTRTLNPVHRVEDLIAIIPDVLAKHDDVQFVIAGGGSEKERFESEIKALGFDKKVRFTGMLNEIELIQNLQAADIYISTSPLDAGLAASTAEAMSCQLPVIHPDVADNASWANHNGGRLYSADAPKNLLVAIEELLALDECELYRMGEHNRQVILERNNLDINMSKMLDLYKKMN